MADWKAHGIDFAPVRAAGWRLVPSQSCGLLANKKVLAWPSAGRPWMTDAERELAERYLPWTREVGDRKVTWRGQQWDLQALLLSARESFTLKAATGMMGRTVLLGPMTEPATWAEAVERALAEDDSIAQEYVEPARLPVTLGDGSADGTATVRVAPVLSPCLYGAEPGGCWARFFPETGLLRRQRVRLGRPGERRTGRRGGSAMSSTRPTAHACGRWRTPRVRPACCGTRRRPDKEKEAGQMAQLREIPEPARGDRTGTGTAHGTCGELVQGVIGERDFLVTFPVDLQVRCLVAPTALPGLSVWPPHKTKVLASARELLRRLGRSTPEEFGLRIDIASPIPEGRGMASSSADIVATCRAVADLVGARVPDTEIGSIACAIEPSDAVMYDHPVVFGFLTGEVIEDPGASFPVLAVAVDPGGSVDTAMFRRRRYSPRERAILRRAYELCAGGLRRGRAEDVGRAATLSARVNQARHAKPHLETLIEIGAAHGGLGVSVAHTGTIAAILFEPERARSAARAARAVADLFPQAAVSILNGR